MISVPAMIYTETGPPLCGRAVTTATTAKVSTPIPCTFLVEIGRRFDVAAMMDFIAIQVRRVPRIVIPINFRGASSSIVRYSAETIRSGGVP